MSVTSFAKAIDNIATTVSVAFTASTDTKLYVASTTGISLSGSDWVRVSTARSGSPLSILKATAIGSDANGPYLTLPGAGSAAAVDGYTNVNLNVGDAAELRVTAGAFNNIATAVNNLESGTNLPGFGTSTSITGTTSLTSSDFGAMHVCSGTSANYTVTLPSPTGNAGKLIGFRMAPGLTKLVTISRNTSENIDGVSSQVMWANEVAILGTDGTNWYKVSGKSIPMICKMNRVTALSTTDQSYTSIPLDNTLIDNTGLMADTTNGRISIVRKGTYIVFGAIYFQPTSSDNGVAMMLVTRIQQNTSLAAKAFTYTPAVTGITCPEVLESVISISASAGDYVPLSGYTQHADSSAGNAVPVGSASGDGSYPTMIEAVEVVSW